MSSSPSSRQPGAGRGSVLVTGGCGLIGSTLARILVDRGNDVWLFDRQTGGGRLSGIRDRVHAISGDLGVFSHVLDAVKQSGADAIFHLGAVLSVPANDDPPAAFHTNVDGMFHVLEAARLLGVRQVLYTSTNATYGIDVRGSVIDDSAVQRPTTLYGATKLFGELLGRFYRTRYGLDFRAVRFPSVVGPGATIAHMSIYNSWAVEKAARGEPYDIFVEPHIRCPVLYFKDAARSLVVLAEAPRDAVRAVCYNLAGVDPMPSAGELADAIRAQYPGARIGFKPDSFAMAFHGRLQGLTYDESSARTELGWKPAYDLPGMIRDLGRELAENRERYGKTPG